MRRLPIPPFRSPACLPATRWLVAIFCLLPLASRAQQSSELPAKGKESDFIRHVKSPDSEELQTAAVRYIKGERVVDLLSVVHIGDEAYYDLLNEHLAKYDAVLYEMVGGEFVKRDEREVAPEMAGLQVIQGIVQRMLGMEFQTDRINYEADNFIHADIDWKEYGELMTSRNQNFGTIFQRALSHAQGGSIPGLPADEQAAQKLMTSMMAGLTSGNTAELKRVLAPILGDSEAMITQLEGDDGTVIVTERNKVVMKILEREMDRGHRSLAVFYGAGHMPDLEKRLLASGFRKEDESWLTAWDIKDTPPEERVNLVQEIFSDPETMQALMGAVQEAMKQLNEAAEVPVE